MSYKFTDANWQEWKKNPEAWWSAQGITWTPEQKAWWQQQDWSQWSNLSIDEWKGRIQKSKVFGGVWDWS